MLGTVEPVDDGSHPESARLWRVQHHLADGHTAIHGANLGVRASAYDAAGGYPDIPLMEDVALVRALPRVTVLPVTARTSARRYVADGWLRRGSRNLLTLARYACGTDPHALSRSYRRRDRSS